MVTICVPVVKRYDCLCELVESLRHSLIVPDRIAIIDNGLDKKKLQPVLDLLSKFYFGRSEVFTPAKPLGVASSWNWFIQNTREERIICNDDVLFAPESIQCMINTPGHMVLAGECGYSAFLIRDSCIEKVGLFDESISPGYGYYEDEDYAARMLELGLNHVAVATGMVHKKSSTLLAMTTLELEAHHRKFLIAEANYIKKWGAKPNLVKERLLKERGVVA